MDINCMSERGFRVTIIQATAGLEETISGNIETLRVEVRANLAVLKNAISEINLI